jgi:Holliday junction resolvase
LEKNYTLTPYETAYRDLVNELEKKGYEVKYIPRSNFTCDYYGFGKSTYITIKPSETEKTKIIISNDE